MLRRDSGQTSYTFNTAAGTTVSGVDLQINGVISENAGASSLVKAGAGTLLLNGTNIYSGATLINAGKLSLGHATDTLSSSSAVTVDGATAILAIGGNSDTVGAVSLKNGGSITGSGGTLTGASYAVESGSVSAKLGGAAVTLTKTTGGTVTLTGVNTYTGATAVNQGKLVINGNISTSVLTTVATGATLGGTGTVGVLTVNGILAPGNSIGTMTATGDVTWNDNDAWGFELGTSASTLSLANSGLSTQDLLNITGGGSDFLKGSGSSFTFDFANGGAVGYYKLVDWAGTTTFVGGDFVATNLLSGLTGTFIVDSGTSALYLNVVPEPNVAALIGGFGILGLLRRRR
jgi:autotransporter-associated beta strand protein